MKQQELFDRKEFIKSEIERAYVNADDDWKREYYNNAVEYLSKHKIIEGGKICAFCRERGMSEPHHHNVWGSMVASLRG